MWNENWDWLIWILFRKITVFRGSKFFQPFKGIGISFVLIIKKKHEHAMGIKFIANSVI